MKKDILKKHSGLVEICQRVLDMTIIFCTGLIAYIFRFGYTSDILNHYWYIIGVGTAFAFICFNIFPLYTSWRGISVFTESRIILFSWITSYSILIFTVFFLKLTFMYSRIWFAAWFLLSLFILILYRIALRLSLKHFRQMGLNQKSISLITYGNIGERVYSLLQEKSELGYNITSVFSNDTKNLFEKKMKGKISDSYEWLIKNEVDQIWIAIPLEQITLLKKIIFEFRHITADIRFIPNLDSFNLINHSISEICGIPIININSSPVQGNTEKILKRMEDIIFSVFLCIILLPIFIIITVVVKFTSRGPILYKQNRVGINNKNFTMLKFRTMPIDVEKETGAVWAKQEENRATPFGSLLRKTSLDEIPQFLNVLKGNMSIVGPRPERPEFVEIFKESIPMYMKKHMVKPGITGWAQINGWRGNTDLKKRIEHDIYYIDNWSLLFDIKIIFMTVLKGFINKNAY
jgi:putative colanic acid biosysnthesis UDP-glucose lipid carrier transferase